jgi:hypothetical protein
VTWAARSEKGQRGPAVTDGVGWHGLDGLTLSERPPGTVGS